MVLPARWQLFVDCEFLFFDGDVTAADQVLQNSADHFTRGPYHVSNILKKLEAANRTEAAALAIQYDLVSKS